MWKWKWESGRQGTGYRKLLLLGGHRWDLWLLDYPAGSHVPDHVDEVEDLSHYRMNVRLFGQDSFEADDRWVLRAGRLVFFRPDVARHSVRKVDRRRMVLSLGFTRSK
jgi:hypothetical protein